MDLARSGIASVPQAPGSPFLVGVLCLGHDGGDGRLELSLAGGAEWLKKLFVWRSKENRGGNRPKIRRSQWRRMHEAAGAL